MGGGGSLMAEVLGGGDEEGASPGRGEMCAEASLWPGGERISDEEWNLSGGELEARTARRQTLKEECNLAPGGAERPKPTAHSWSRSCGQKGSFGSSGSALRWSSSESTARQHRAEACRHL
eukprot:351567-Rhodomonas_salina.2